MPQASTRTLTEFRAHFGKNASEADAVKYLTERGIHTHKGMIQVTDEQLNDERIAAACWYLAEEWDYSF